MMLSRQSQEPNNPKYVHFTNGFPPKELVPTQGLSSGINMHGGFFVGLHEEANSKLTRSQRTIPPLAKGRANYCPVKHRASSSRYRDKGDPFDVHKGTEKKGFTPQGIKRSKPKGDKTSQRSEHTTTHFPSNPANKPNIDLKQPRQTVCPMSTLLHGSDVAPRPNEANYRIFSDVEKETIQNELLGIDEVYKRVCNGSMTSLCSLISPVKGKQKIKQASSMHYIQTSSPVSLNTKPLKVSQSISTEGESALSPEKDEKDSDTLGQGIKNRRTPCNSILVPLPYFTTPSRPPYTAPARFRENHNRPRIYAPRSEAKQRSGAFSSLSGWSSPSVINFNAADLPRISRPATRPCGPTGSIIGVQNKSQTGKVAIVAAVDTTVAPSATPPATPPATAASGFYQPQFDNHNEGEATAKDGDGDSPDIDSINSDDIDHNENMGEKTKNHSTTAFEAKDTSEQDQKDKNKNGEERSNPMSGMSMTVSLSVIDETGGVKDVEIYHPEGRDLQKQEQVTREIQEAQEKRKQEIETLLDEHESLVHEVNDLSKELQN